MTYDLKVILKYCGRSSHDLLVLCGCSWPLSGPQWAVLGRDQTEKWPWLEREGDLGRKLVSPARWDGPDRLEAQSQFFSRYVFVYIPTTVVLSLYSDSVSGQCR